VHFLAWSICPEYDENGKVSGFASTAKDITESKRTEEALRISELRYRELINLAVDGILIGSHEGIITEANECMCKMSGRSKDELVGKHINSIFTPEVLNEKPMRFDLLQKGEVVVNERTIIRPDTTSSVVVEMRTKMIAYGSYQSIYPDITERKKAEQELIIAKERAEESDNLKTAFLQNMSHEIRTPLSGIIGFSRMLNTENLSKEDIQEFTNIISISGERLIETVNNILEMSKIQTGQVKIVSEPIVINSIFSDLFDFFSHQAKEKNINLNYHSLGDINRTIYSDEGKLYQVFSNLITNSIKFTDSGSIDFGYDMIGNKIRFYVKDTGVGVAEDLHDMIFDRFT